MHLMGIWFEDFEWIELAQVGIQWRAVLNTIINFLVPRNVGNFLTSRAAISLSRRTQPREIIPRLNVMETTA
jgi:hypothetical protein